MAFRAMIAVVLRLAAVLAVVVATIGWLDPGPVGACTCAPGGVEQMREWADVGFVGSFDQRGESFDEPVGDILGADTPHTFTVERWIIGETSSDEVTVYSPFSGAGCGFELRVGERVAVFASEENGWRPFNTVISDEALWGVYDSTLYRAEVGGEPVAAFTLPARTFAEVIVLAEPVPRGDPEGAARGDREDARIDDVAEVEGESAAEDPSVPDPAAVDERATDGIGTGPLSG